MNYKGDRKLATFTIHTASEKKKKNINDSIHRHNTRFNNNLYCIISSICFCWMGFPVSFPLLIFIEGEFTNKSEDNQNREREHGIPCMYVYHSQIKNQLIKYIFDTLLLLVDDFILMKTCANFIFLMENNYFRQIH